MERSLFFCKYASDSAEKVEPGYKASMISVPKVRILLELAMRSFHDVKKDIQQLEKALQYTSEAESLLRHIEDYRMKGETFELRGRLFGFKGEFEKAKEYFLKALQTFEENNSTPKVYLICLHLSILLGKNSLISFTESKIQFLQ